VPIYEYRRPDGTTFEVMQSMSEDSLTHDPETGVPVVKVLHAPSIHFKGSGFYNTDYGKQKNRNAKSESDGGSSDSGKSDSNSSSSSSDSSSSGEKSSSSGEGSKSKDTGTKTGAKSDSSSS
jgi:putative FmdB family regulatory protein